MPIGAAIIGSSLLSGYMGNQAAGKAADAQGQANAAAIAEQRRQFDLMRQDSAPYRYAGSSALGRLSDLYGIDRQYDGEMPTRDQFTSHSLGGGRFHPQIQSSFDQSGYDAAMGKYNQGLDAFNHRERGMSLFQKDPGYQFRLDQGISALDRSANARGIGLSGGALQQLNRYNQDYASNEIGNYANRLAGIAGVGQTANNSAAQLGQNNANSISSLLSANGNNQAQNYTSSYGAWNNALQGGLSNYLFYDRVKGAGGYNPNSSGTYGELLP